MSDHRRENNDCDNQRPDGIQFESYCGIGPCKPRALQCCRNVLSFTLFYGLASFLTQTLSVYIGSQITALEKQFKINNTTVGIILSCNDIGFLCMVLFVSHFGKNFHIPRILSAATFMFGISGILSSLCYLLQPFYLPKLSGDSQNDTVGKKTFLAPLCVPGNGTILDSCDANDNSQGSGGPSWPIWLLGISMVLQGIAKSPRTALSTTYIDNNNPVKTKTGFYLGIGMTMNLFGPAFAIAIGGVFRRIPVDLQDTVLTPTHPKWIGAWWMGFLVFGVLGIFVGIPLLFFPKEILPPENKQHREKGDSPVENVKDLPRSILRVFKSPVYTLALAGLLVVLFAVVGTRSFSSKYVEKQFMVPAYKANILLGIQSIISASIGTFTGGVLTSRLQLTRLGCLRMVVICSFTSLCLNFADLFLGCETPHIQGFSGNKGVMRFDDGITVCTCDTADYFPVCGGDGVTYFSPCFAGCTNQTQSSYGGCTKVSTGHTTAGMCETDCPYLYYYLGADVGQKLIGTMAITPLFMTLLRSVDPKDKTIAFAIFSFLASLLGFLPAPIFFGYVIDSACLIWDYSCGMKGACAQYNLEDLRYRLKSGECGGKVMSFIFYLTAFLVLKAKGGDERVDEDTQIKKSEKIVTTRL